MHKCLILHDDVNNYCNILSEIFSGSYIIDLNILKVWDTWNVTIFVKFLHINLKHSSDILPHYINLKLLISDFAKHNDLIPLDV